MKDIQISDITLDIFSANRFTFREKTEVAKYLDRLSVSCIELGCLTGGTADSLLIKSVASCVEESAVAVAPGLNADSVRGIWNALSEAKKPRLQVCAAASTSRMEYVYHKKADGMLKTVDEMTALCRSLCDDVEFIAEDATRADFDFLCKLIAAALCSGAGRITLCDSAGVMLPDEFSEFIGRIYEKVPELEGAVLGVSCSDALTVADACAVAAIKSGASEIKTSALKGDAISLLGMSKLLSVKGDVLGIKSSLKTIEINRVVSEIEKLADKSSVKKSPFEDGVRSASPEIVFTKQDSIHDIVKGAEKLGYYLDDKDKTRVWKAFSDIAQRKDTVSAGELDAIIASETMQVSPTYTLENYVVTTGNAIDILAHVKLKKGDTVFDGLSLGDGPIDAAFLAIEKITGHHYELDDFQLQAVTEGREAMGQTIVKLRSGGKVYSGKGISTDIIGSGVAAYVNALNKIIYEEENI